MEKNISITKAFLIVIASAFIISFCIIGYFWISDEYGRFQNEVILLRNEFSESQKTLIRNEVEKAVDFIRYSKSTAEERLKTEIKNRTCQAVAIASNIYNENKSINTDAEIRKMIKDALRPIRFNQGRGYYFAADSRGTELLFSENPKSDVRWDDIEIAKIKMVGEGFFQYTRTKPGGKGDFSKIVYIRYFEPYQWVIGTGEYLDDVEKDIQNEVLERLIRVRFNEDGYLFASTYTGDPLFTNGKITRGTQNIWEMTDADGIKIAQLQRKAVENPRGDFVQYSWIKLNNTKPSPKISFVKGFPDWEWIVGAGVYSDEIEEVISQKRADIENRVKRHILKIIMLLGILLITLSVVVKLIHAKMRKNFVRFMRFFERAALTSEKINPEELSFSEFRTMAHSANAMIENRLVIEKSLHENEIQLRQAQKMQAIGTLAGGIAHDFNNILVPIMGYAQMVMEEFPQGSLARKNTEQILVAAERARALVRQIMTFSRKGDPERKPLKLDMLIREVSKLLRATFPATIDIRLNIQKDCGSALVDPIQFHQVLMNLCTNSYHAMREKGGVLTIGLDLTPLPPSLKGKGEKSENSPLRFGEGLGEGYLRISISDTGSGIPSDIMERIFEPFFTTKGIGEGTGMGLSVVLGIIKNHDGYIRVESEANRQTTFYVYLPVIIEEEKKITTCSVPAENLPKGQEHILLVDDEEAIVKMMAQMLSLSGYKVTPLTDTTKAIAFFRNAPESVNLVISDMTMPKMTGLELAAHLKAIRADIPIILCSGYNESVTEETLKAVGIREYLTKPIVRSDLAKSIRNALSHASETNH